MISEGPSNPRVTIAVTRQLNQLKTKAPDGMRIIINDADIFDIQAELEGPVQTPYEGGVFRCKLVLPADFPKIPPKGYFTTKIFHPNVSEKGEICVNTLKKDWNHTNWNFYNIFEVIKCLLIVPFPESALNEEAGKIFMEDYDSYFKYAKLMTDVHAKPKNSAVATAATSAPAASTIVVVSQNPPNLVDENHHHHSVQKITTQPTYEDSNAMSAEKESSQHSRNYQQSNLSNTSSQQPQYASSFIPQQSFSMTPNQFIFPQANLNINPMNMAVYNNSSPSKDSTNKQSTQPSQVWGNNSNINNGSTISNGSGSNISSNSSSKNQNQENLQYQSSSSVLLGIPTNLIPNASGANYNNQYAIGSNSNLGMNINSNSTIITEEPLCVLSKNSKYYPYPANTNGGQLKQSQLQFSNSNPKISSSTGLNSNSNFNLKLTFNNFNVPADQNNAFMAASSNANCTNSNEMKRWLKRI